MNEVELTNYGKLANEIRNEIEKTKTEIQKLKEDLQKAKIFRKNRIEYEVIANVIDKHPERTETEKKLATTKKELTNLEVISNPYWCKHRFIDCMTLSFLFYRKLNKSLTKS